jgi:hypothetical protein
MFFLLFYLNIAMKLLWTAVLSLGLCSAVDASAQPIGVSPAFSALEFQSLLQRFVNEQYLKSFRRLGIEEDFDHGHLLFDARSPQRPVAILYHTQELSEYASMDPRARNWIQWVDRGTIENASRYERKTYPHTASWDWFLQRELAALRQHHTILDKMLDPALLGVEVSQSRQWVFTRTACDGADAAPAPAHMEGALRPSGKTPGEPSGSAPSSLIRVLLPEGTPVCLSLSQT